MWTVGSHGCKKKKREKETYPQMWVDFDLLVAKIANKGFLHPYASVLKRVVSIVKIKK